MMTPSIFLQKYIDIINPHFKDAGMTPNMITSISLAFGLLACYLYYKSYYIFAALAYIVSYFFDTMDGYFARYMIWEAFLAVIMIQFRTTQWRCYCSSCYTKTPI